MTATAISVAEINKAISVQLADKETVQALITTTFNGMSEQTMRQAMLEGMMRGFTFQDFLNKDVYAIPYGNKYSLVTSIDYMLKIAAQHGLVGTNAPVFEDDANGRPKTCSVTVKRMVNGSIAEFTSLIYVSEYNTGKNLWVSKTRTMSAKVALGHALRIGFPEELAKSYIEDEMQGDRVKVDAVVIDTEEIRAQFAACNTREELVAAFHALPKEAQTNETVVRMGKARTEEIKAAAAAEPVAEEPAKEIDIPIV